MDKEARSSLAQVKDLCSAEAFPHLVQVLRALSQPVITRGRSSANFDEELDLELAKTLEQVVHDTRGKGADCAIESFLEEWN